jgi:type IV secretory pathway VirB2 component (pilin)
MTASHIDPLLGVLVALAGLGVLVAFRSGARGGYKIARHSQQVTRMGGNLGRALGIAAVIVGVQWAVVRFTADPRAWGVVFGVPALFAGAAIARMFSVTELIHTPDHKRGRR